MEDLITRLTAAIDEVERIAREAKPGPWTVDDYLEGRAAVEPNVAVYVDVEMSYGEALGAPLTAANARHIAANGPDVVLRQCAAHRKILARHQEKTACRAGHGGPPHQPDCFDCAYCDGQYWPCLDLRNLAEFYGVEP